MCRHTLMQHSCSTHACCRGVRWALHRENIPKIRVYYGSGWVGRGLTRIFFFFGKSSQNSSKPVLIFWSSIQCHVQCVLCLYIVKSCSKLLGFECSVHVSDGFKKIGCGGALYPILFWIFFNFAKPLWAVQYYQYTAILF